MLKFKFKLLCTHNYTIIDEQMIYRKNKYVGKEYALECSKCGKFKTEKKHRV